MENSQKKYLLIVVIILGIYFFNKLHGWRCLVVTSVMIGWIYNIVYDKK
jgi:hypothetical protein